ncbi:MAG: diguanylate cyclase [Deltaproteobacteria bacterium]|nr:diguanylate cyclase [Deltaproteobacteria bacterium]
MMQKSAVPNQAEALVVRAVESLPDGLVIADAAGKTLYRNAAARRILAGADGEQGVAGVLDIEPAAVTQVEEHTLSINGTSYAAVVVPLREGSRTGGLAFFLRDGSLLHQVEDIKKEFVTVASHEMLTPLTSIKNALSILLGDAAGERTREQERFLLIVKRNADRISRLIEQYLDLARLEKGRLKVALARTSLQETVAVVFDELQQRAAAQEISLTASIAPEVPAVMADAGKLEQILFNLLGNAVKYAGSGAQVEVSAGCVGDAQAEDDAQRLRVQVSVSDNGPGIPESMRERVFDQFARVANTLEASREGVGLGLAIAKQLVELHGGRIAVMPNRPHGCRFVFDLRPYDDERRDPAFRMVFDQEFQRARQSGNVLSLIAIVVKHVEELAKQVGDEAADAVLKYIETTVKRSLFRQNDIVVHRKENELFVLFCEAQPEGARAIINRINDQIAAALDERQPGLSQRVKVCIGFATYPNDADNQRDLFQNAFLNARRKEDGKENNTDC